MVTDFKIFEKLDDYNLYHFTDLDSIFFILKEKEIVPMFDKMLPEGEEIGISTTRNKNFKWNKSEIRITLDKRELQQHYKIKPIHWFNMRHYWDNSDDYRKYGPEKRPYTNQDIPANQYEERIITPKPVPVRYIKKISVNTSTSNYVKKELLKLSNSLNIPVVFNSSTSESKIFEEVGRRSSVSLDEIDYILDSKGNIVYPSLTENSQILEGKQVGMIYHFTSIYNLYKILSEKEPSIRPIRTYISCTRNWNMQSRELKLEKQCCRITLDGNKISHRYKIKPHFDFNYPDSEEREERILNSDGIDLKKYVIRIDILNNPVLDPNDHFHDPNDNNYPPHSAINSYTFKTNQYLDKAHEINHGYELLKNQITSLNSTLPIFFVDKMKPVKYDNEF